MGFDVMRRTRTGATPNETLVCGAKQGDGVGDDSGHVAQEEHQRWKQALHGKGGIAADALARVGCMFSLNAGGVAHQRGDVVGQQLGGQVDDQGLLTQPRDGLKFERVLQALEGFFDTPALVVEIADEGRRESPGV